MAVRLMRSCDIEGKKGACPNEAHEHQFSLDGDTYGIDLCEAHHAEMTTALANFVSAGRKERGSGAKSKAIRKSMTGKDGAFRPGDVRKWLQEQGREVNAAGRIPFALVEEYKAAHPE